MTDTPQTVTVHVPLLFRQRGGRKLVITPDGVSASIPGPGSRQRGDPTLVKALARAFRWKHLLDTGRYASISEIAAAEKIDRGYVGSILRLTLLAQDIVEAIPDSKAVGLSLPRLLVQFPPEWLEQRDVLLAEPSATEGHRHDVDSSGR
jgi:hypothetical protein